MHPREFGSYRILKLLPPGGMGRVYLAENASTGRRIALKLIETGPGRDQEQIAEAERRGASLQERLCRLDPRIADVLGYGDLDGFFYIEMEYIEGHDLSEVLAAGPIGVPFATRIGIDLCETLSRSHAFTATIDGHSYRGIVHGDIKPRNIRITPAGEVRVLDFGIAKALSLTRQVTTNQFGSSQYSSPERLNTGEVDFASDLWSVAVVLFEAVAGHPYFEADSGPRLDYLIRNYRQWRAFPPGLPRSFEAVLRKALHPDAAGRYPTAETFAEDLRAAMEGRPTQTESAPPPVADDDPERTRRTSAPVSQIEDPDATRRTAAPPGQVPPKPFQPVRPRAPLTPRQRQIRLAAALVVVLLALLFIWRETSVWSEGASLVRELETERLTDMKVAWDRYSELAQRNHVPFVLWRAKRAVQSRMIAQADRVIREYRNSDAPSVSENDWVRAHDALDRALELDPGNREIRAKRYVTEGHINRIRGTARSNAKLLSEARSNFEQAIDLMPRSPDPYLGLARLYVYSMKDVERAEDALKKAAKQGHESGKREKAQLADGYRDRAERLLKEADRATGMPEEGDYLRRAKKDFQRAESLYRAIVPFSGSANQLRTVLDYLAHIEIRLKIVEEGA